MIESLQFTNLNGNTVALNTDDIPIRGFHTTIDVRSADEEKPQDHGLWPSPTYLGKRLIQLEGDIFGDTSAEYISRRREVTKAFYPQLSMARGKMIGTLAIKWVGISEVMSVDCALDGWPEIPIDAEGPARSPFMVSLKSFDPRMYGVNVNAVQLTPGYTTPVGRTYNKTYPYTYPNISTANVDALVTNSGDVDTSPIVRFDGPGSSPEIRIVYPDFTYSTLRLAGLTLAAGEYVIVDFARKTVTINGVTDGYNYKTGLFWTIPSGTYTVRTFFDALPTPTTATLATVSWRNAYIL